MTFRGFDAQDLVACFTEAAGGGDIFDINAPRNRPARDPGEHVTSVQWHSEFFQYELATPIRNVSISHPAAAGRRKFWGPSDQYWIGNPTYKSNISYEVPGQTLTARHTLFAHNLGYVPLAFVAYNGRMLMPGVATQIGSDGRSRFVSPFITSTIIGLREVYNSSRDALPAVTRSYQVIVFRVPVKDAQRALFGKEGDRVILGRGKIDTSKQYLRRVGSGDTPFDIDRGPTIDINRGRTRIVTGGTVTTEPGYAGSFSGPAFVAVGV